jgi:hypothetical protein
MESSSRVNASGALLLLIGCGISRADSPDVTRHDVPDCSVSVEAPVSLRLVRVPSENSLLLERPDGTAVAIACLPKRKVVAQSLTQFAQFRMGRLAAAAHGAQLAIVPALALERSLGRPVVVAQGAQDGLQLTRYGQSR